MLLESLLLAWISIWTWLYFSIFCHEMGHFIAAKVIGLNPYFVRIGSEKRIFQFNLFDSVVEFNSVPNGGITCIFYMAIEGLKFKLILMYLCGPLANCLLLFIILNVCKYTVMNNSIIFINLIGIELSLIIMNLTPIESRIYGKKHSSDGRKIIDTLTKSDYQLIHKNLNLSRYASIQNGSLNNFFNNDPKTLQILFDAKIQFNKQNFAKVIELLEPFLSYSYVKRIDKVYIIELLTSIVINFGEKKYLQKADQWSNQALLLANDVKTVRGTRGAILIELGRYSEGKEMLLPLTEADNDSTDIAVSCCYIAKADYFLGNEDKVKYWLKKAEQVGTGKQIMLRIQRELNFSI